MLYSGYDYVNMSIPGVGGFPADLAVAVGANLESLSRVRDGAMLPRTENGMSVHRLVKEWPSPLQDWTTMPSTLLPFTWIPMTAIAY